MSLDMSLEAYRADRERYVADRDASLKIYPENHPIVARATRRIKTVEAMIARLEDKEARA